MNTNNAYKKALDFATTHYENFPVVSVLIRKSLRKHIAIIYWFARTADDIADEGNDAAEKRLEKLSAFETRLQNGLNGNFYDEYDAALAKTIQSMNLNEQHFFDLLTAFKQDVEKHTFGTFDEILYYCKHSANPVGRLILELHDIRDDKAFQHSDAICTALQLTNFYQDLSIDIEKQRIYISLDELRKFGVNPTDLQQSVVGEDVRKLLEYQVQRAENLFNKGSALLGYLSGRLKPEISWTILGGMAILEKIKKMNYSITAQRPKLQKKDFLKLFFRAFGYARRISKNHIKEK